MKQFIPRDQQELLCGLDNWTSSNPLQCARLSEQKGTDIYTFAETITLCMALIIIFWSLLEENLKIHLIFFSYTVNDLELISAFKCP